MLKEKLSIERKKAVMITADFTAPTTESYAMAWLRLCNNAREYKDVIWRIENDSGNKVYVWCDPKYKETVIEFLTGIVYYYQEDKGPTSVRSYRWNYKHAIKFCPRYAMLLWERVQN